VCFDFLCLASWAAAQPPGHASCPLCKAPLTAIEYDWRAPDDFKRYVLDRRREGDGSVSAGAGSGDRVTRRTTAPHWAARGHQPLRRGHWPRRWTPALDTSPDEAAEEEEEARARAALQRRRDVYARGLCSLHIGSNRISRFRDFTPADMRRSAELQSRARRWIRRELGVFEFLDSNAQRPRRQQQQGGEELVAAAASGGKNAEFMLSYIIAILKVVDIKSSTGVAEEKIAEMLGRGSARLFLHELESWLRSPFSRLEDWDRTVQYRERRGKGREVAGSRAQGDLETPLNLESIRHRDMLRRHEPD